AQCGPGDTHFPLDLEVETLLSLVADQRTQKELDGVMKKYKEVSERMATHGYSRTMKQSWEKLKNIKSDYRSIKDHNGRTGSNWRCWMWFSQMDAIYGHRPVSNGRESGFAAALLETMLEDGECFVTPPRMRWNSIVMENDLN
uniref:Myb/SANT-like DNA-binding domain-containing protein n=1 Tax=Amphiprion percula TaxID=161767 RepID=A0A3P8U1L7_AMPPE